MRTYLHFAGNNSSVAIIQRGRRKKKSGRVVIFTLSRNRFEYSKINARYFIFAAAAPLKCRVDRGLCASRRERGARGARKISAPFFPSPISARGAVAATILYIVYGTNAACVMHIIDIIFTNDFRAQNANDFYLNNAAANRPEISAADYINSRRIAALIYEVKQ